MISTFNRLASGSLLKTINLALTVCISFFMMPFIINILGDKWYGLWVLIGSLMGYYMVLDFGLLSAIQRYLARSLENTDELNRIINTSLIILTILSIGAALLCIIFWVITPHLINEEDAIPTMRQLVIILGIKTVVSFPFMVFNGMLSAKIRFDITSYIGISKSLLRTLLIIIYLNSGYGIVSLAIITLCAEIFAFVLIAIQANKLFPQISYKREYFDWELAKTMLHFGKFTFIGDVSNLLKFKIDDFIIANYIGLASITIYTIAFSLFNYALQLINAMLGGILSVLSKNDRDSQKALRKNFLLFTEVSAIIVSYLAVFLLTFGDDFINLWMGNAYEESYAILVIFSFILLITGSTRSSISLFYATANHKHYAYINIIDGMCNLAISLYLVDEYGLIGIALGTLIPTVIFRLFILTNYACKIIELATIDYWRIILPHWGMATILGVLIYLVFQNLVFSSLVALFLTCIPLSFIYFFICFRYTTSLQLKNLLIKNLRHKVSFLLLKILFNTKEAQ